MTEAEIQLHEDAEKRNKGIFTNKLFELRFYGYKSEYKPPSKLLRTVIYIGLPIAFLLLFLTIIDFVKFIAKN
ncbi:hypothetical protein Clo1100_1935 [Clostridium sp. BNL1100]|nr:hypothetical protein Clo1100_1935 [Clostridium sp. BNL1100]